MTAGLTGRDPNANVNVLRRFVVLTVFGEDKKLVDSNLHTWLSEIS